MGTNNDNFKKLPEQDQNEGGIIRWMRFLGGKRREEFEDMAKKDEYIEEAYDELKKLSLDEQKRLEYEVRQKAIRDHNSQMKSAERRGEKRGRQTALKEVVAKMTGKNMSQEEIADLLEMEIQEIDELMKGLKK